MSCPSQTTDHPCHHHHHHHSQQQSPSSAVFRDDEEDPLSSIRMMMYHHSHTTTRTFCTTSDTGSPVTTPKRCNTNKRTIIYCDHNINDTSSLERSLKRVRLSNSGAAAGGGGCPGELRLQRDLRYAVQSHQWTPIQPPPQTAPFSFPSSNSSCSNNNHGKNEDGSFQLLMVPPEAECWRVRVPPELLLLVRNNNSGEPEPPQVTVTREDSSSMELVLSIVCHVSVKLYLSFPRRYPHQPPLLRRIQYVPLKTNSSTSSSTATASASSSCTMLQEDYVRPSFYKGWNLPLRATDHDRNVCSQEDEPNAAAIPDNALQKIIIPVHPDEAADLVRGPGIVVMEHGWSPVQRVTDVCEWLIAVVLRQHSGHRRSLSSASLSVQCPVYYGSSSSTAATTTTSHNNNNNNMFDEDDDCEEDGQNTPVHRNGFWFSMDDGGVDRSTAVAAPEAITTAQPTTTTTTTCGSSPFLWSEDATKHYILPKPSNNIPDKQTRTGNVKRDDELLPRGRFDLGYDREQQQPMTMMMDCFDDLDL